MEPLREMGKLFILLGVVFLVVGALLTLGPRLPFRLGRLPGDLVWEGRNTTVYFPIVTSLLLSAVLTLILWLVALFRK
ncbi:MAG: DUF2905 domain-containing protein [Acidobacteriia bacterium]|jgi:hypothetical protein|nr:DUF2905 domain-containing protein [Terriglobia bacterium]